LAASERRERAARKTIGSPFPILHLGQERGLHESGDTREACCAATKLVLAHGECQQALRGS
jgi:hypothetical protein